MHVLLAGVDRECVCAPRAKCAFSPGVEFAYLISFVQLSFFFLCFSECVPGIVYHPVDFSCCFIGFWSGAFDGDSACALVSFAFFLCVDVDDIFLFKCIDSYSLHFYDDFGSVVGGSDVYFSFVVITDALLLMACAMISLWGGIHLILVSSSGALLMLCVTINSPVSLYTSTLVLSTTTWRLLSSCVMVEIWVMVTWGQMYFVWRLFQSVSCVLLFLLVSFLLILPMVALVPSVIITDSWSFISTLALLLRKSFSWLVSYTVFTTDLSDIVVSRCWGIFLLFGSQMGMTSRRLGPVLVSPSSGEYVSLLLMYCLIRWLLICSV